MIEGRKQHVGTNLLLFGPATYWVDDGMIDVK
jgi:hypothetical protein